MDKNERVIFVIRGRKVVLKSRESKPSREEWQAREKPPQYVGLKNTELQKMWIAARCVTF